MWHTARITFLRDDKRKAVLNPTYKSNLPMLISGSEASARHVLCTSMCV